MILAADVGGTKTNIGLFDPAGGSARPKPHLVKQATYPSGDYENLESLLVDFLGGLDPGRRGGIAAACFGVAGPVFENRSETPNLPWVIDGQALSRRFRIDSVTIINDLVATAEGIPALAPDETVTLQTGETPDGTAPRALIAAGTGLGMALLVPDEAGEWRPLGSEGGHVDLAPRNTDEIGLLEFMMARYPAHVSVERVVSGPGLVAIYQYLVAAGPDRPNTEVERAVREDEEAAAPIVSGHGLNGTCPVCVRALDLFVSLYGAVAGNLALISLATGGVYLGGGIAPKILPKLLDGTFVEAFQAKGRFRGLMETIPVHVILNPDTALLGAARRGARDAVRSVP